MQVLWPLIFFITGPSETLINFRSQVCTNMYPVKTFKWENFITLLTFIVSFRMYIRMIPQKTRSVEILHTYSTL